MTSNARLLLFETMIRDVSRLSYPLLSDLNMVIRTGRCERTEIEYRELYKAAGFKLTKTIQTRSPTGMAIIEGKAAGETNWKIASFNSVSRRTVCPVSAYGRARVL